MGAEKYRRTVKTISCSPGVLAVMDKPPGSGRSGPGRITERKGKAEKVILFKLKPSKWKAALTVFLLSSAEMDGMFMYAIREGKRLFTRDDYFE